MGCTGEKTYEQAVREELRRYLHGFNLPSYKEKEIRDYISQDLLKKAAALDNYQYIYREEDAKQTADDYKRLIKEKFNVGYDIFGKVSKGEEKNNNNSNQNNNINQNNKNNNNDQNNNNNNTTNNINKIIGNNNNPAQNEINNQINNNNNQVNKNNDINNDNNKQPNNNDINKKDNNNINNNSSQEQNNTNIDNNNINVGEKQIDKSNQNQIINNN